MSETLAGGLCCSSSAVHRSFTMCRSFAGSDSWAASAANSSQVLLVSGFSVGSNHSPFLRFSWRRKIMQSDDHHPAMTSL